MAGDFETTFDQQCSWAPRRVCQMQDEEELLSHYKKKNEDHKETLAAYAPLIKAMRTRKDRCHGCGHDYLPEDNLNGFNCRYHLCLQNLTNDRELVYGCTGKPVHASHLSPPCVPCVHTSTKETHNTYVKSGNDNFIAIPSALARIPPEEGGLEINERHIAAETQHNTYLFCNRERMLEHNPFDLDFLERIRELDLVYLGGSLSITEEKKIREMPVEQLVTVKRGGRGQLNAKSRNANPDNIFGHVWQTPHDVPTREQILRFFDEQ